MEIEGLYFNPSPALLRALDYINVKDKYLRIIQTDQVILNYGIRLTENLINIPPTDIHEHQKIYDVCELLLLLCDVKVKSGLINLSQLLNTHSLQLISGIIMTFERKREKKILIALLEASEHLRMQLVQRNLPLPDDLQEFIESISILQTFN